ncbi:isocitrate lyase/PEP mutase family protein [Thermomonospora cellulosilytica]|uniref:2-methylisocitrate lyase-like PEP mutase family enzyme n=1 Tax=Thermomonospora cellulosilytica TaxID=1411118 RepID=A0A7W3MVJ4_9ACTN|nr:isocitrate lyase/phosphoenolpyruvate mutase family protein [Thermomonospora cellulosilytica]MBA9002694.1 2-methylisocitrate lyase-like PEP mutase family enzyme [Thermomonospora cellulosilytica]
MTSTAPGRATGFAALHRAGDPLVLPNAWDAASAAALLAAGFPAIGTTSLGVAAGGGLPDAARSAAGPTRSLARLLRRLPCPVTVDIEDGFSDDPDAVAAYTASLEVDGVNIEDCTRGRLISPRAHAAKITAIKSRCPEVFVNARVDTFWTGRNATVPETVERALRYVAAGADGVFVPGRLTSAQIREITSAVPVPVNVLASPDHTVPELARLGVRRVSCGSLLFRAALDRAVEVASAVRDGAPAPPATSYGDVQDLASPFLE